MPLRLFGASEAQTDLNVPSHDSLGAPLLGGAPVGGDLFQHAFDVREIFPHITLGHVLSLDDLTSISNVWPAFSNVYPDCLYVENVDAGVGDTIAVSCTENTVLADSGRPSLTLTMSDIGQAELLSVLNASATSPLTVSVRLQSKAAGVRSAPKTITVLRPDPAVVVTLPAAVRSVPTFAEMAAMVSADAGVSVVGATCTASPGLGDTTIGITLTLMTDQGIQLEKTVIGAGTVTTILPAITVPEIVTITSTSTTQSIVVSYGGLVSEAAPVTAQLDFGDPRHSLIVPTTTVAHATYGTLTTITYTLADAQSILDNTLISPTRVTLLQSGMVLTTTSLAARYLVPGYMELRVGINPRIIQLDTDEPLILGDMVATGQLQAFSPIGGLQHRDYTRGVYATPLYMAGSAMFVTTDGGIFAAHSVWGYTKGSSLSPMIPDDAVLLTGVVAEGVVHGLCASGSQISSVICKSPTATISDVDITQLVSGNISDAVARALSDTLAFVGYQYESAGKASVVALYDATQMIFTESIGLVSVYEFRLLDILRASDSELTCLGTIYNPAGYPEIHIVSLIKRDSVWYATDEVCLRPLGDVVTANTITNGRILQVGTGYHVMVSVAGSLYWYELNADFDLQSSKMLSGATLLVAEHQNNQTIMGCTRNGFGIICTPEDTAQFTDSSPTSAALVTLYVS